MATAVELMISTSRHSCTVSESGRGILSIYWIRRYHRS